MKSRLLRSLAIDLVLACFLALSCSTGRAPTARVETDGAGNATATAAGEAGAPAITAPPCLMGELRDLVPEAARFTPESVVSLRARAFARDPNPCVAELELAISHLGQVVHREIQLVPLSAGVEQTAILRWKPPARDFIGYMARLTIPNSSQELSTGIDVSSNALAFPRYGYISTFPLDQPSGESAQLVAALAERYHINLFQLYDWFWRHEDLLPTDPDGTLQPTWTDLFGRVNSLETIRALTTAIHNENGLALGYVAMYAARERYEQVSRISPALGLFEQAAAQTQVALPFGGERYLFLFDPANPQWQERMATEYLEAIAELNLDGVQIDQFGARPTLYRADGTPVELNETFAPFLEAIDRALEREEPRRGICVFNLVDGRVDGYGVSAVAETTACDALYSEIWFTTDTYEELRAYIEQLRRLGRGRPVIMALYPQYGEDVGRGFQAEEATLNGLLVAQDHPGYTGSGFVAEFDDVGDSITWNVDFAEEATVTFVFRYANATGATATRTLFLDGLELGKIRFGARSSWSDWAFDAWLQQRLSGGRHRITLEYAPDDVGAVNIDRMTLGAFDEASVRLQNAVVFASGATVIQLGDDIQSLAHEYFPNRSKSLQPGLRTALRAQYSFITAHETILFAPQVEPIEERLERISAVSPGHTLIAEGSDGIWTLLRATPDGDVIHLVNLVGTDNAQWRDVAPVPLVQEGIRLRYELATPEAVTQVLWASPDEPPGTFQPLSHTTGNGHIEFEVPRLRYWDVVLIRQQG